jgi:hypothetical protein
MLFGLVAAVLGALAVVALLFARLLPPVLSFSVDRWDFIGWLLAITVLLAASFLAKVREHAGRIGLGLLGLMIWPLEQAQLHIVDPIFLKMGEVERLIDGTGSGWTMRDLVASTLRRVGSRLRRRY